MCAYHLAKYSEVVPSFLKPLFPFSAEAVTPRRSPRLSNNDAYDIFVFKLTKANKGVLRVSSNSSVIHKVGKDNDLNSIKALLRSHSANDITFVPSYGLYWLRKGSKEPVALNTDEDLTSCKQEYLSKTGRQLASIRLACRFIENRGVFTICVQLLQYLL